MSMFKLFQSHFSKDHSIKKSLKKVKHAQYSDLNELFELFNGESFDNGIYRIINFEETDTWSKRIYSVFPSFAGRIIPFGYDWLGRFFCLDLQRLQHSKPLILLFSHFTNEVLEIPEDLLGFHNSILVNQQDEALEAKMFQQFLICSDLPSIETTQCAELVLPLYLGGIYNIENMKIFDVAASWDICAQLLSQVNSVEEGTNVNKISISYEH